MTSFEAPVREAGVFLAEYTAWLWSCGATCIRTEKNVTRMADAFAMDADVSIMPGHVQVSVCPRTGDGETILLTRRIRPCGINFSMNASLSRLSWEVADGKADFATAVRRMEAIVATPPTDRREVLMLASLANASFCRLFGGDATAMLVVFIATMAGFGIRQRMLACGRDIRLTFLVCAFVSSAVSAGAYIFQWGATPEIAIGTSVLYLIPGVPYINAVSDLIDRHYLCAMSRFADAVVLTACLSAGLCAGMWALGMKFF